MNGWIPQVFLRPNAAVGQPAPRHTTSDARAVLPETTYDAAIDVSPGNDQALMRSY